VSSSATRRTRRPLRARLAALAAAAGGALLLAVGCGEDDEPPRTTAPATKAPGAIAISSPSEDAKIRARDAGGRLRARAEVAGTAEAGAEVIVNGGCDVEGCLVHVTADGTGEWEAEVRLVAPADEPRVRVAAYYRGSVVGPEDRVEVRLAAPRSRERAASDDDGDRAPRAPVPPDDLDGSSPGSSSPSSGGRSSGTLILIGDSLGEGMEDILPMILPGWRVRSDSLTSRPLATGMSILARTQVPDGAVIAVSLFTNDDPSRTDALEAAVRQTVRRAGPGGCAIWATIARPPFNGRSYAAANALLRRLDAELGDRLAVVPWAEGAARAGWLASDRVHATPDGYRARAQMYADAARR
jgi:hypothetical protein